MKGKLVVWNKQVCHRLWQVKSRQEAFHRIYYVYSGDVKYRGSGREVVLKQGHLYIFPYQIDYDITHDPDKPLEVMWFHIDPIVPLTNELVEVQIKEDSLEEAMVRILEKGIREQEIIVEGMVNMLMTLLKEKYLMTSGYHSYIEMLVTYIHAHIQENLTNEDLANLVGYNKNYMIRQFKAQLGQSPRQYIIKTKMNYAKKYLLNGTSIKETAFRLGYKDPNIFSRDFKHYYSIAPSNYREIFEP